MPIDASDRERYKSKDMVGCVLPAAILIIKNIVEKHVSSLTDDINAHIDEGPRVSDDNATSTIYQKLPAIVKDDDLLDKIISTVDPSEKIFFEKVKGLDASIRRCTEDFLEWFMQLDLHDAMTLIAGELMSGTTSTTSYESKALSIIGVPGDLLDQLKSALSGAPTPTPIPTPKPYGTPSPKTTSTSYTGDGGPIIISGGGTGYSGGTGGYSGAYGDIYGLVGHEIYGKIWTGIDPTSATSSDIEKVAERKDVMDTLKMGTTTATNRVYSLKEDEDISIEAIDEINQKSKSIMMETPSLPKGDAIHLALKLAVQLGTVAKNKLRK